MPSSPSFHDYTRNLRRFFYTGISLQPQDALGDGKAAFSQNIRSYMNGTVTVRNGLALRTETPLGASIDSIFRLNDTTPYADIGSPYRRFVTSGTELYGGSPVAAPSAYNLVDAGPYSGDPVTAVVAAPYQSPRPFLYIGDSVRSRKVNTSFNDMSVGLAPPLAAPTATLAAPEVTYLNSVGVANWVGYGPETTPSGAVPTIDRLNTVVTHLLYDSGSDGMASVALADMTKVTVGATIDINSASPETVIVQSVHPPVSPTTIGSILYDVGTTGLCTIQPDGGFSVGQIEQPLPEQIRRRYEDLNLPTPIPTTVTRTVDFPVNSLVLLGGVEVVRILSVAIGQDGTLSFRCFTNNTFASTDAIAGIASFRAYFNTTKAVGNDAIALALEVTITPLDTDPVVGGVQSPMIGGTTNWALVGARATQPEDLIRVGIRVSAMGFVQSARIMLNVSDDDGMGGADFLHNYYVYEWRQSDLISAIQQTSEAATGLIADAQADAVTQGQVDALYDNQYGQSADLAEGTVVSISPDGNSRRVVTSENQDTGRQAVSRDGLVALGSSLSRQLALGNDQWITLECRVGDLTRVGTDTTLTMGVINAAAILIQVAGTTTPFTLDVCDAYLMGGYGPEVGMTFPPYVYRYRYRSTITGERGNPSPTMLAGMQPRRGRVVLSGTQCGDPQCDIVDWFRYGGALARWAYVGSSDNDDPPVFNDDLTDSLIDGGEALRTDLFQPWPIADLPRMGTCNVVGNAVEWVSGDLFDTRWAQNSIIIIDGRATALYAQPASTTRLTVIDNIGTATAVEFSLPNPTILGQPLPALWGGAIAGAWFNFACGDISDGAVLHWTHGNDPDATSERNTLVVSTASEPLQNGFFDDGVPYVFSSDDLYRIVPTFGQVSDFAPFKTDCGRGLWSRWAMAPNTPYGTFFLAKDGIYRTSGGSAAISITDPDLRPWFPQDGSSPQAIRGLYPPDFTVPTRLKLTFVDQLLYFDYQDTNGDLRTMVYDPRANGWTPDVYALAGVTARISESGPEVHDALIGAADGNLYQMDANQITDVSTAVVWALWTPWDTGETDPRAIKQWGDAVLDMHPGSSFLGISVTPVVDNGNTALATRTVGQAGTVRETFLIEVGDGDGGEGVLSQNFGMQITGRCETCDIQRPILYYWEPAFLFKQVSIARRATDWEDLGYKGAKFVQGVVIRANTFGQDKTVHVQYDGVNSAPQVGLTLTLNHNGEQAKAYPLGADGWAPFIAELVRLQGADDVPWTLLDWRFIWEPAPELATQWETQYTTFGAPGFLDVHDGIVAYQSTQPLNWFIEYQDGSSGTYILPSSNGLYLRLRQITQAQKGKAVRFRWTSPEPFRLFKKDCSVRVQAWGAPGGYRVVNPFGGPHFEDGAGV